MFYPVLNIARLVTGLFYLFASTFALCRLRHTRQNTRFGNTILAFTFMAGLLYLFSFAICTHPSEYSFVDHPVPNLYVMNLIWTMNCLIPVQVWLFSMSYFQCTIDDNENRALNSHLTELLTRYVALLYAIAISVCFFINEATLFQAARGKSQPAATEARIARCLLVQSVLWICLTLVGVSVCAYSVIKIGDLIRKYGLRVNSRQTQIHFLLILLNGLFSLVDFCVIVHKIRTVEYATGDDTVLLVTQDLMNLPLQMLYCYIIYNLYQRSSDRPASIRPNDTIKSMISQQSQINSESAFTSFDQHSVVTVVESDSDFSSMLQKNSHSSGFTELEEKNRMAKVLHDDSEELDERKQTMNKILWQFCEKHPVAVSRSSEVQRSRKETMKE